MLTYYISIEETTMYERLSRALLNRPSAYKDPENYAAISVHQPYAGLIWLAGMGELGKDIEIRSTRILHRGPLVIAASKRVDAEAYHRVQRTIVGGGIMRLPEYEAACGVAMTGKTVAVMNVVDCRPMIADDRERSFTSNQFDVDGQYAWVAGTITALHPFETTGAQGIFRVKREFVDGAKSRETTRAQRDATWKALDKRRSSDDCSCGLAFPKHLAEFMNNDPRASHTCRCGSEYVVKRNKFVLKGTATNPLSEVRDDT